MCWTALLLSAALAPCALGQATVTLDFDVEEPHVNEPFVVTIRVDNFQTCDPPVFPQIKDASVRVQPGGNESSQTSIINGRKSESHSRTYLFELTPTAPGELVIPPVKVLVDGRTLQTKSARFVVRPGDAENLLRLEITCDRQRIYVGQRVRLILTIWIKPPRVQGQLLGTGDMLSFLRGSLGPFPPRDLQTDVRQVPDATGTKETYYAYATIADVSPDRPGRLNFDDVELVLQYPTRLSRDVFGGWQVRSARNLRARATAPDVEILPLPTSGRPPNFTGAVGTFGITASAQPTSVRVGDPITLAVEIRGDGPIDTLPPPDLAADPRLTEAFRVPREDLAGEASGSRKRFTQVIRAQRAGVTEIPPIEYPYFDPDRELYAVALSDPIPIQVAPAAELPAGSLVDTTAPAANPGAAPLRALDGLRGNETRESELLGTTAPILLDRLVLALLVPPVVFLGLWGYTARVQNRSPAQRRREQALHVARRRLDDARRLPPRDGAVVIAAALAGYLADRLDQPAARFTGRAAVDFLAAQRVAPPTLEEWNRLVDRCDQASFGATIDGDTAALADQARQCLHALERERL